MTDAAIERLVTLADAFELWGAHGGNLITEADAKPTADSIRTLLERVKALEGALTLALDYLGELEPGDSRAVSNEYVAMSTVLCRIEPNVPGEDLAIIVAGLRARNNPNAETINAALDPTGEP